MSKYSFNGRIDWKKMSYERVCQHIDKHIFGIGKAYIDDEIEQWKRLFEEKELSLDRLKTDYKKFSNENYITKSELFTNYVATANEIVDDYSRFYVYENKDNVKSINFVNDKSFNTCIQLNKYGKPLIATCFYRSHLNEDGVIISFAYEKAMGNSKRINTNNTELLKALRKKPLNINLSNHSCNANCMLLINYSNIQFTEIEEKVLSYLYYYSKEKLKDKENQDYLLYKSYVNKLGILFGKKYNKNIYGEFSNSKLNHLKDHLFSKEGNKNDEIYNELNEYILLSFISTVNNRNRIDIPLINGYDDKEYLIFYNDLCNKLNMVYKDIKLN